jgi:hypothetical protein
VGAGRIAGDARGRADDARRGAPWVRRGIMRSGRLSCGGWGRRAGALGWRRRLHHFAWRAPSPS